MPDEGMNAMNQTVGHLTATVENLTKSVDQLLGYLQRHDTILGNHEKRLGRVEDSQTRGGENWKTMAGFMLGVLGVIIAAWAKARLGL